MRLTYSLQTNRLGKLSKQYYLRNELIDEAIDWLFNEHGYFAIRSFTGKTHSILEVTIK